MTKSPTPQPTFFFTATTTTHTSTLSLHDALPILVKLMRQRDHDPVNRAEDLPVVRGDRGRVERAREPPRPVQILDRKSTRLNSSHRCISYAVFCLKKKKNFSAAQALPESYTPWAS